MKSTFRTVMLWMGLLVVIFLAWHFAQIEKRETPIKFSDFLARVAAHEVRSVRIDLQGNGPAAIFFVTMTDGENVRATGVATDGVLQSLQQAEVPFWTSSEGATSAWVNMLTSWAPFLLLIGFWVFFMRQFKGTTSVDKAKTTTAVRLDREPTAAEAPPTGAAATALADVRALVGGPQPARVLITGPTGSGKTHLVRRLGRDLGRASLLADGASFTEIFVGVAAARMRDLFAQGRKEKAAFVGIDGLDDVCRRRGPQAQGEHDERTQAMMQLTTLLDELSAKRDLAFVAVTSRPDLLDEAIVRRFDRVVTLGLPDRDERETLMAGVLPALPDAAARTEGWTRGDLRAALDDAARRASDRVMTAADVEAALAARERVRGLGAAVVRT